MNKILEKIDMDKEVLSAMPKNNKKNISKYIQYVQELKKEYETIENDINDEMTKRYKKILAVKKNKEIDIEKREIDEISNLLDIIGTTKTSYEKMGIDKKIYKLGRFYKENLENINIEILECIKKFKEVGIDLGTRKLILTSEGETYHLPDKVFKQEKRCRREQRRLSRRNKESKRYEKQRIILAKAYQRRKDIINDNLHKFSNSLVKEYDVIYMEDLDIKQLLTIQDNKKKKNKMIISSLGKLVRIITYKANMYDKQIHKINRYYPSSQICSHCQKRLDIGDKEKYICPYCGAEIDRDINAAINIKNKGQLSFS